MWHWTVTSPRSSVPGFPTLTTDPFRGCEEKCNHDLVRGVLVEELVGDSDGPHLPSYVPLIVPAAYRAE